LAVTISIDAILHGHFSVDVLLPGLSRWQ